jgi:short-subunit dehydrogenase
MLLNVAGGDIEGGFMDRTTEQISSIINVNIGATLNITHEALKRRPRNKRFYIVFVSSLASLYPMPLKACYAASKRFLSDFAYALGSELGAVGVTVTSLCPGGLATTDEIISCIDAQGFWGNLTTNSLETVARRTITKSLRGQRVYTPGIINHTLGMIGKIIPRAIVAKVIHTRWQKAQARG